MVKIEKILLTGSTGVLGSYMLKSLLAYSNISLCVLVKSLCELEARARLATAIKKYDPEFELDTKYRDRLEVLCGNICSPHFGLPSQQYNKLTKEVGLVIHCAAETSIFLPYNELENTNVGGTKQIAEFCLENIPKHLCFVSSYSILGDKLYDPSVCFQECDLDIGQRFPGMGYQESKFRAEKLLQVFKSRGLSVTIVRPGNIWGESVSGRYPYCCGGVPNLSYEILKTAIETRTSFTSNIVYDVTPVDFVSAATIELALHQQLEGVYHLTNPNSKTLTNMIGCLKELGYFIRTLPFSEYQRAFKEGFVVDGKRYRSIALHAFRAWFDSGQFSVNNSAAISARMTNERLACRGIACPAVDKKLISTYVNNCIERGYFVAPQREFPSYEQNISESLELR